MLEARYFPDQDAFSLWLEGHHDSETELWVGFFKKGSGMPSLSWSESVDAALCYGWIDGVRKKVDELRYAIRFTPRKSSGVWSAVNVGKADSLIRQGKMKPEGLRAFMARTDHEGYSVQRRKAGLPDEYELLIRENSEAWHYYSTLAASYRRDSDWWVMSAKKEETRLRRLGILIASCEAGEKIPFLRGRS